MFGLKLTVPTVQYGGGSIMLWGDLMRAVQLQVIGHIKGEKVLKLFIYIFFIYISFVFGLVFFFTSKKLAI